MLKATGRGRKAVCGSDFFSEDYTILQPPISVVSAHTCHCVQVFHDASKAHRVPEVDVHVTKLRVLPEWYDCFFVAVLHAAMGNAVTGPGPGLGLLPLQSRLHWKCMEPLLYSLAKSC